MMGGIQAIPSTVLQRVRLRLSRTGPHAITLSHLNQIDALRRGLIAAGWPVALSGNKRPRPRISFGPAIAVGVESDAEYCDVDLRAKMDISKAGDMLSPHLPEGYSVRQVKSIPRFFPSLDETLNLGFYKIRSPVLDGTLEKWEEFWKTDRFMVVKKKADKEVQIDARACVKAWDLKGALMEMYLRFGPGRTLKPERIIQSVLNLPEEKVEPGLGPDKLNVKREQMFCEKKNDMGLIEP